MKRFKLISMIIAVLIGFSCNKDDSEALEMVRITLLPTIGITQDVYTPLRSASVNDTVYAVQIYEEGSPYYYGLFNDVSKMEISLTTNKKYTFKVSSYLKASGSGLKKLEQNGLTTYFLPDSVALLNKFVKGDKLIGISDVNNVKLTSNKYSRYPEIDIFYQESEITITKGMSSLEIPLKRTGFGLGFSVDGLTSGKMEVYFAGDTIHLDPTVSSYFSIRSFIGGTKGLFDVASVDTYFVDTPISVKWIGDNGSIVTASRTIKLKRNYQLPVEINLNTSNQTIGFEKWYSNPPINGLVAWYPFNGNANDESGNGKNGTVSGATLTTDRFGNANKAYSFNGTSDGITTNCVGPTGNTDRTISFWAKVVKSAYDYNSIIYYGENSNGKFFSVYFLSTTGTFRADVGSSTKDYKNTSIFDSWHFYTVVFQNNISLVKNALMYMDGKLLTDFTYLNPNTYTINTGSTYPLYIGRSPSYDAANNYYYNFKGSIDDIGLWNRALTQQEITDLYNAN
jgi:hypothetical protein